MLPRVGRGADVVNEHLVQERGGYGKVHTRGREQPRRQNIFGEATQEQW